MALIAIDCRHGQLSERGAGFEPGDNQQDGANGGSGAHSPAPCAARTRHAGESVWHGGVLTVHSHILPG